MEVGEFVLTQQLVSKALAMVSEDATVNRIFSELLGSNNHLYIRHAARYVWCAAGGRTL